MKHGAPFTDEEDEYLRHEYQDLSCAALAAFLGRTVSSTQNRLRHLGLRKRKVDKPLQTKTSIFFDDDLMQTLRAQATDAGISMSAYVNQIVRKTIQKKSKVA